MKRISILGSTGSIGTSTLRVVDAHPGRFEVRAIAAGSNLDLLESQARRYGPELVAVGPEELAGELRARLGAGFRIVSGRDGLIQAATLEGVELLVSALVGAVGLEPTYAAVDLGRDVALANKESLVVAGRLMTRRAAETGALLLPVDSEHNAVHQCLRGERAEEVQGIWLTASGGPFLRHDAARLEHVTAEQALQHPTWIMGRKITIDSATLMNKGLEVIEAHWLFDLPPERIRVVVHPQSVVHSMVELVDGSFKAQLGITDMRHPIQYALTYPDRCGSSLARFDPVHAGPLQFEEPDLERFPCLGLAYRALELGGAASTALNAANEIAVQAFLDRRIAFNDIPGVNRAAMERHAGHDAGGLEALREADRLARRTATEILERRVRP